MPLLADEDAKYLREQFATLAAEVTLTLVTRGKSTLILPGQDDSDEPEDASAEVKQIATELAATSPRIKVVDVDARSEADRARELAGELAPAIIFSGGLVKGRLRYFGLPAGYEMSTLVATVMDVGSNEPMVPPEIATELDKLEHDVHIKVFVTPS
jgi:alkyl hydroperoxide reductase subunit AhpF